MKNQAKWRAKCAGIAALAVACALVAAPIGSASAIAPSPGDIDDCAFGQGAGVDQCEVFVAPDGRDSWPGTADRPLRTIERAQKVVQQLRSSANAAVMVTLADGTYRLARTLTLGEADSGDRGVPVVWRAAAGASPTISGGDVIKGWESYDSEAGIYRARARGVDTRQLYVNGDRVPRAALDTTAAGPDFTKTATGYNVTGASAATMLTLFEKPARPEVSARVEWRSIRCAIEGITQTNAEGEPLRVALDMEDVCWHAAFASIRKPAAIENALALLDTAGEWYLDRNSQWLYYKPRPGEDVTSDDTQIVAPRLETLVDGEGTRTEPVHDIEFKGITFADATWLDPNTAGGYAVDQAGFRFQKNQDLDFIWLHEEFLLRTPGNVSFRHAQRITFEGNRFTRLGAVGLDLDTGSQENAVIGNRFDDISSSGIQIGGIDPEDHHPTDKRDVTRDNLVSDNYISKTGQEFTDTVGIFAGYTKRTTIEHNDLRDLPYSGISVGYGFGLSDQGGTDAWQDWATPAAPPNVGWGIYDTPSAAEGNRIIGNRVHNYMLKNRDGGAIYTLGWQGTSEANGMLIEGNVLTDQHAATAMLYLDAGSRFITVRRNVAFTANPPDIQFSATGSCSPWGDFLYEQNYWSAPAGPKFDYCPRATNPSGVPVNVVVRDNNQTIAALENAPHDILDNAGPRPLAGQAPTVTADKYAASQNTTLTVTRPGVLGNDSDPNGRPLSAAIETQPTNGVAALLSDGSLTYTPRPGFTGNDSFTYIASDGANASSPTTVTVAVSKQAAQPTTVTATASPIRFGGTGKVVVTTTPSATGQVQLVQGTKVLATGSVKNGSGTIALPAKALRPGQHKLTVRFLGNDTHAASEAPVSVIVRKAKAEVSVRPPAQIKRGERATVPVRITSTRGVNVTGKVRAIMDGKKVVATVVNGTATLRLPKPVTAGQVRVRVQYLGSKTTMKGSVTFSVKITR